jgi:hypothetical protein
MKGKGTHIDSPFTGMAPTPGVKGVDGIYDEHPNVGPKASDSTIPLKFFSTSIPTPGTMPSGPSMDVEPAPTKKS